MNKSVFNYYYGDESSQFSFYRIPRQLITGIRFKQLSAEAKLLYGLMLDRMGLSARNGWYDEYGRVYIYYTANEVCEALCCYYDKALKLLAELDTKKGVGLIERVKQGQGRPTKIYVKNFSAVTPPEEHFSKPEPSSSGDSSADHGLVRLQTAENPLSRPGKPRGLDPEKTDTSYIKSNQTELIYTDPSIYPYPSRPSSGWMDRSGKQRSVKEAVGYGNLCARYGQEDVDEVVELMTDVLSSTRPVFRIGGKELPAVQVKARFCRLDRRHLEYVFDCLRNNTAQVRNIRAYLLTALYNAPATISNHDQAAVQHDFGP